MNQTENELTTLISINKLLLDACEAAQYRLWKLDYGGDDYLRDQLNHAVDTAKAGKS